MTRVVETGGALLGEPGWAPPAGVDVAGGYPKLDGLSLSARHRWAGSGALPGGDFYDFLRLADGAICLVLGDVSGAGSDASVVARVVTAEMRATSPHQSSPLALLHELNRVMLDGPDHERYCTAVMVVIGLAPPRATIVTGGHALPLLVSERGSVREVGTPGMPIGMFGSPDFSVTTLAPAPGDTLLLFTDGVTEARTESGAFKPSLLVDLLRRNHALPLPALTSEIVHAVEDLQGGWPRDDVAVVAVRWLGEGRPT